MAWTILRGSPYCIPARKRCREAAGDSRLSQNRTASQERLGHVVFHPGADVSAAVKRASGRGVARDLDDLLDREPPKAILVGLEGALEQPFVGYAKKKGYLPLQLLNGQVLWLAGDG
jgi:hypothetical protein